jgi:splicing factor 3B subunit 3
MHLYALTLQRSTAITCTAYGNFSAPKMHEVVVSHGKVLELLRPDAGGKMQSICSMEAFGLVRSLAAFRLPRRQHRLPGPGVGLWAPVGGGIQQGAQSI